jgi:hypothetical protein
LSGAISPLGNISEFSNPTRILPPSLIASLRHENSSLSNAQIAQSALNLFFSSLSRYKDILFGSLIFPV